MVYTIAHCFEIKQLIPVTIGVEITSCSINCPNCITATARWSLNVGQQSDLCIVLLMILALVKYPPSTDFILGASIPVNIGNVLHNKKLHPYGSSKLQTNQTYKRTRI